MSPGTELPKCVCSPKCKTTERVSKSHRMSSAKRVAVIRLPETRNLRRSENNLLTPLEMQNDEPTLIIANLNRQQANKKSNQSKQNNDASEAIDYSPLNNSNLDQVQVLSTKNSSNETDREVIGMKIRSGFFNNHTMRVTSYVDAFYVGNLASLRLSPLSAR